MFSDKKVFRVLPILLLGLIFLSLIGCTSGGDTFIIQNTRLEKLFDGNVSGDSGLIPFLNVDGNVYAKDFITTSKVADSKDGIKALDKISNIGEWLKNGEIQYDKHYAGVEFKKQFVKDIIITYENKERCFEYDSNIIGKIEKVCETKSVKIETPVYDTQIVKGLSMETRVAEMEKMIYELNERIKVLEGNK